MGERCDHGTYPQLLWKTLCTECYSPCGCWPAATWLINTQMKYTDSIYPALTLTVIVGAVALLQTHSIQFWMESVGTMGIAWSILLEVVALWLWWQRRWLLQGLGVVASLMLLAGPLYQVGSPLVSSVSAMETAKQFQQLKGETLQRKAAILESSLETALSNSEERGGWLNDIQESRGLALDTLDDYLQTMAPVEPTKPGTMLVMGMQGISLVLFQFTAVLALLSFRQTVAGDPSPAIDESTAVEVSLDLIDRVVRAVDQYMLTEQLSQKSTAMAMDLSPKNLSLIRNHRQLLSEGKRTAPDGVILKLATELNVI